MTMKIECCDICMDKKIKSEMIGDYYPRCRNCLEENVYNYLLEDCDGWQEIIFLPNKNQNMHYGLEIEVCFPSQKTRDQAINLCIQHLDYIYLKKDSTLDYGFEIVSHPATLDYHKQHTFIRKILPKIKKIGGIADKKKNTGFHIHASRNKLTDDEIKKIIFFIENYWYDLFPLFRREQVEIERYAERYYAISWEEIDYIFYSTKSEGEKYRAINLTNKETIEFRMFRSSLNPAILLACLELVDSFIQFAKRIDKDDICWENYIALVQDKYDFLNPYINRMQKTKEGIDYVLI